jgi:hypothetical protein
LLALNESWQASSSPSLTTCMCGVFEVWSGEDEGFLAGSNASKAIRMLGDNGLSEIGSVTEPKRPLVAIWEAGIVTCALPFKPCTVSNRPPWGSVAPCGREI